MLEGSRKMPDALDLFHTLFTNYLRYFAEDLRGLAV